MNDDMIDLQEGYSKILMNLAIGGGLLVYVAALIYAGYESLVLMLTGVKGEGVIFASLGLVSLEINCLALPLAIHFWVKEPAHKTAAYIAYGMSFGLTIANVIVSFNRQAGKGGQMPEFVSLYAQWLLPITPLLCGIMWSVLFMLDPSRRAHALEGRIKAASQMAYLRARQRYAIQNAQYRATIEAAAQRDQLRAGDDMFNRNASMAILPAPVQVQGVEQRHPLQTGQTQAIWQAPPETGDKNPLRWIPVTKQTQQAQPIAPKPQQTTITTPAADGSSDLENTD